MKLQDLLDLSVDEVRILTHAACMLVVIRKDLEKVQTFLRARMLDEAETSIGGMLIASKACVDALDAAVEADKAREAASEHS